MQVVISGKPLTVQKKLLDVWGEVAKKKRRASFWWYLNFSQFFSKPSHQEKVLRALAECGKPFVMLLPISVLHVGLLAQIRFSYPEHEKSVIFVPGSRWTPPFCQKDWRNSLLDDDQLLLSPRNWWNLSPPTYYKNGWPEGLPGRMQLEKVIVIYHHPKGSTTFFLNRGNAFLGGVRFNKHLLKAWFWGIFCLWFTWWWKGTIIWTKFTLSWVPVAGFLFAFKGLQVYTVDERPCTPWKSTTIL